jgi:hypothetical protein
MRADVEIDEGGDVIASRLLEQADQTRGVFAMSVARMKTIPTTSKNQDALRRAVARLHRCALPRPP